MVFKYNSEQQAIEARLRIAAAEGLPKYNKSKTLYYLNYVEYNSSFYIDARNEISKDWYAKELLLSDENLIDLPLINDIT